MKRILVVVDMQNDFITGELPAEGGEKIIPNVIKKMKQEWDLMYLTRDTHFAGSYEESLEGKRIPGHCWWKSPGWSFVKEIYELFDNKSIDSECVIQKSSFGVYSTIVDEIEEFMYEEWDCRQDNLEIELCGVCTDICVISNAMVLRSAFPDAQITVDASCCAGTSKEMHEAALKVMNGCLIDVVNDNV